MGVGVVCTAAIAKAPVARRSNISKGQTTTTTNLLLKTTIHAKGGWRDQQCKPKRK